MKILLTGGTGFIGSHLARHLRSEGHEVSIVSRRPGAAYDWSPESIRRGVAASDAVVHLAGEGLTSRRWTAKQKQVLRDSRVRTTQLLADAVAERKPSCFITASAVGYYGPSEAVGLDESAPPGNDFLARLCVDWEASATPAVQAGVRVVKPRFGVVLGKDGGALRKMLPPFRMFVGGPVGDGRQWVSWIHIADLTALVSFLLGKADAGGAFNATAPNPVRMREFARALGRALHRPSVLPAPAFAVRLLLGEAADVLLKGQHVLPKRATAAGFSFAFPEIDGALRDGVNSLPLYSETVATPQVTAPAPRFHGQDLTPSSAPH
jgi:uncharacterized protein (TIGR01777 family)